MNTTINQIEIAADVEELIEFFASMPDTYVQSAAQNRAVIVAMQGFLGRPVTRNEARDALNCADKIRFDADALQHVINGTAVMLPGAKPCDPEFFFASEFDKSFADDSRVRYEQRTGGGNGK